MNVFNSHQCPPYRFLWNRRHGSTVNRGMWYLKSNPTSTLGSDIHNRLRGWRTVNKHKMLFLHLLNFIWIVLWTPRSPLFCNMQYTFLLTPSQGGTCSLVSLKQITLYPLFPKIKILISYVTCSLLLPLFPCSSIFRHLFHWNKCPYSVPQNPWDRLVTVFVCMFLLYLNIWFMHDNEFSNILFLTHLYQCCLFWFNVTFNNFSVISRRCLVVTGSTMLTLIVLAHWSIMPQTLDMIPHPVTLSWHWVDQS